MDYENKDWEMNFADMFLNVFYKWKGIVAVALVCALLLGGYQAWQTIKDNAKQPDAKAVSEYIRDRDVLEKQLANAEKLLSEKEAYLLNAPLMQMDSENAYVASAYLVIKTDYQIMPGMDYQNVDETSSILTVYQNALSDGDTMHNIAQKIGLDTSCLSGLIEVEKGTGHLLRIRVYHAEEAAAEEILDLLLEHVQVAGESATELICNHTADVMLKSVDKCHDFSSITSKQETHFKKLTTYQEDVDELNGKIKTLKKSNPSDGKKSVAKQAVIWSVLGAVAGAVGSAVLICLVFFFRDSVYSAKELDDRVNLNVLGSVPSKSKYADPVVRSLRKLEGRAGCNMEANLELIAENITNYRDGAQRILVVGTVSGDQISAFVDAIGEKTGEAKLVSGGNLLRDAGAVRELRACDAVILLETCGKSRYQQILLEAEKAASVGKSIVGCVVMD